MEEIASTDAVLVMSWEDRDLLRRETLLGHREEDMSWESRDDDDD